MILILKISHILVDDIHINKNDDYDPNLWAFDDPLDHGKVMNRIYLHSGDKMMNILILKKDNDKKGNTDKLSQPLGFR